MDSTVGAKPTMTTWDPPAHDRPPVTPAFRLDPIHLRILQILERDARTSVSRIAREVGLTDNAVRYRLRKLRSSGVVRRVTVHVDPARLGRHGAGLVLLKLTPDADLQRLRSHPSVALLLPTRGAFQGVALLTARDAEDLERSIEHDLRRDPGVEEVTVLDVGTDADLPVQPSACTRSRADEP